MSENLTKSEHFLGYCTKRKKDRKTVQGLNISAKILESSLCELPSQKNKHNPKKRTDCKECLEAIISNNGDPNFGSFREEVQKNVPERSTNSKVKDTTCSCQIHFECSFNDEHSITMTRCKPHHSNKE